MWYIRTARAYNVQIIIADCAGDLQMQLQSPFLKIHYLHIKNAVFRHFRFDKIFDTRPNSSIGMKTPSEAHLVQDPPAGFHMIRNGLSGDVCPLPQASPERFSWYSCARNGQPRQYKKNKNRWRVNNIRTKFTFLGKETTSPVKVVNCTQARQSTKSIRVDKC